MSVLHDASFAERSGVLAPVSGGESEREVFFRFVAITVGGCSMFYELTTLKTGVVSGVQLTGAHETKDSRCANG